MSREIERLLQYEEPRNGDFYYNPEYRAWFEFGVLGNQDFENIKLKGYPIRRRETIEDEPKWEEVKDRIAMRVSALPIVSRYEDGTFHYSRPGEIQSHLATHYFKLPLFPQENVDFETFWQTNKEKLIDVSKDAARLVYEKTREQ